MTSYSPKNVNDFTSSLLNFNGVGLVANIGAGTVTNIDYTVPFDVLITGANLIVKNVKFGDSVSFQVVDANGILAPAGTVLNQFVSNWCLVEDSQKQFEFQSNYPAKIYQNLVLRIVYTSVGIIDPELAINFILHKVLM